MAISSVVGEAMFMPTINQMRAGVHTHVCALSMLNVFYSYSIPLLWSSRVFRHSTVVGGSFCVCALWGLGLILVICNLVIHQANHCLQRDVFPAQSHMGCVLGVNYLCVVTDFTRNSPCPFPICARLFMSDISGCLCCYGDAGSRLGQSEQGG